MQKAEQIAVGMTVGSWTDLPALRQEHLKAFLGHVVSVVRQGRYGRFSIAYPTKNVTANIGALLTVVFGKLSLDGAIRLIDLRLPDAFQMQFPGPALGLAGLRDQLNVYQRPFVMSIFKSENGRSLSEFKAAFLEQINGGVDLVKDDEIYYYDHDAPFDQRIQIAREMLETRAAKTGQRGLYAANLTGSPHEMVDKALKGQALGAMAYLVSPFVSGLDVLVDLRRQGVTVPLLAHPSFVGGQIADHHHGVSPHILLGLLPRLAGADFVLYPSPYGSVAMPFHEAVAVKDTLLDATIPHKPVIPGPSAGIHHAMVPQLLRDFGLDCVVNAGGAIHGYTGGTQAGAQALKHAVVESAKALVKEPSL